MRGRDCVHCADDIGFKMNNGWYYKGESCLNKVREQMDDIEIDEIKKQLWVDILERELKKENILVKRLYEEQLARYEQMKWYQKVSVKIKRAWRKIMRW